MPTYTYKCDKCLNEFEVVQRVVDEPLTVCDRRYEEGVVCRGGVHRVIVGGGGFILNGGGWAKDGY